MRIGDPKARPTNQLWFCSATFSGTIFAVDESVSPRLWQLEPFILGFWRHIFRGIPFSYDAVNWSAVFQLGMYTVCTHRLATVIEEPFLDVLPSVFVYIALAAWIATFFGFLHQSFRWLSGRT